MKKILFITILISRLFAETDHDVLQRLLDDKDTKFAFFVTEYEGKNGEYYAKLYEKTNNNWHLEKHLTNLKGEADLQVGVMGLIDDAVSNIKSKINSSKKSNSAKKIKSTTTKDKSEKKKNKKSSDKKIYKNKQDKTKIKKKKQETTSKKTGSTTKKKTTTKKESKTKNVEKKPTKQKAEKKKKNKTSKDSK